jgi:phospholipid transport system transporter-binding protein
VSAGQLQRSAPGEFRLSGELSFATVPALVKAGGQLFEGSETVSVDLAGVGRSDSAGLALLVSWIRLARHHSKQLEFHSLPEQLQGLARVSGVARLLSLDPS